MSKYRYVNTEIWDDDYINLKLDPLEKLLFVILITNKETNIAGVYRISMSRLVGLSGLDMETIKMFLNRFERDKKACYFDGWIIMKNGIKHQEALKNYKIARGITSILKSLPEEIKQIAYDRLSIDYDKICMSLDKICPNSNSNSNSNFNKSNNKEKSLDSDKSESPIKNSPVESPKKNKKRNEQKRENEAGDDFIDKIISVFADEYKESRHIDYEIKKEKDRGAAGKMLSDYKKKQKGLKNDIPTEEKTINDLREYFRDAMESSFNCGEYLRNISVWKLYSASNEYNQEIKKLRNGRKNANSDRKSVNTL